MKCVYVLTSQKDDYYYEQFLLSIISFNLYNAKSDSILIVDEITKQNLTANRTLYENYISEIIVAKVPANFSQKEASRWIKTSIPNYISGEFLYIDCDTIITENLNYIFSNEIKIGAVFDTHVKLDRHHLFNNFQNEDIKAGFISSLKSNIRFNGGVIYCDGSSLSLSFFKKWHSLWLEGLKKGCSQDMPSLNQANFEDNIITELNGEWNCQISYNMLPYLYNAKIIHYFSTSLYIQTSPYILSSPKIFNQIKDTGEISKEIYTLLKNPKTSFQEESQIIAGKEILDSINCNLFLKLFWLRKKMPNLFNFLNKLSSLIKNTK